MNFEIYWYIYKTKNNIQNSFKIETNKNIESIKKFKKNKFSTNI
jgi:hypothetical protein